MADKKEVSLVVNPNASKAIQEAQREAEYLTLKRIKDAEEEKKRREEEEQREQARREAANEE